MKERKRVLFPIIAIVGLAMSSWLSGCADGSTNKQAEEADNNFDYLASKTPYPFQSTKYSAAPTGYEISFITHVGRHGSRHLSSAKYDITIKELLDSAAAAGAITAQGEALRKDVIKLIAIEKGNYGMLSKLGKTELTKIGERAGKNYKALFEKKPKITAEATYEMRAQESRDLFVQGMQTQVSVKAQVSYFEEEQDPYLRPFDVAPLYIAHEEGEGWEDLFESYEENEQGSAYAKEILLRFFNEEFYERLDSDEFAFTDLEGEVKLDCPADAVNNLYNLYIISAALSAESDLDFKQYFTDAQLKWYESVLVVEDFYAKGPSLTTTELPSQIMAPLVKELLNSVDSACATCGGEFRFAHAETIIPLATFLDVPGATQSTNDPEEVTSIWDLATISPMAANIQWLIYSNGKQKLVKMLYNEVEIEFPATLNPVSGLYYDWNEVKAYYSAKVIKLGFAMNSSLEENLETLRNKY